MTQANQNETASDADYHCERKLLRFHQGSSTTSILLRSETLAIGQTAPPLPESLRVLPARTLGCWLADTKLRSFISARHHVVTGIEDYGLTLAELMLNKHQGAGEFVKPRALIEVRGYAPVFLCAAGALSFLFRERRSCLYPGYHIRPIPAGWEFDPCSNNVYPFAWVCVSDRTKQWLRP